LRLGLVDVAGLGVAGLGVAGLGNGISFLGNGLSVAGLGAGLGNGLSVAILRVVLGNGLSLGFALASGINPFNILRPNGESFLIARPVRGLIMHSCESFKLFLVLYFNARLPAGLFILTALLVSGFMIQSILIYENKILLKCS